MLFSLLLLLPFVASAPTIGLVDNSSLCSDILIISARGSNAIQASASKANTAFDGGEIINPADSVGLNGISGEGETGVVAQKVQQIIQQHTHLKVGREAVFYPAIDKDSTGAISQTAYAASLLSGIANLTKQIVIQAKTCPQQKLVLLGYSQGANVIGDALSGGGGCYGTASACTNPFFFESQEGLKALNTSYAHLISTILFWGDPRHSLAAQAKFTTGFPPPKLDGFFARTPDAESVLEANYCKTKATCKIQSICDAQDYFCAAGANAGGSTNITESVIVHVNNYLDAAPVKFSVKFVLGSLGFSYLSAFV